MNCVIHGTPIQPDSLCEDCVHLRFDTFRRINRLRCEEMAQPLNAWRPWEWTNAMAGEVGEACNITKKMSRVWPANQFKESWNKPEDQRIEDLTERLKLEIGDVAIYADLLASSLGTTLEECIRTAFNNKSDEIGSLRKV